MRFVPIITWQCLVEYRLVTSTDPGCEDDTESLQNLHAKEQEIVINEEILINGSNFAKLGQL